MRSGLSARICFSCSTQRAAVIRQIKNGGIVIGAGSLRR
jgi:hypothetical protein